MQLGTRRELARAWRIDPRNSIFDKIPSVYRLKVGNGKVRALYPIDPDISAVLMLDYLRCNRAKSEMSKVALMKSLDDTHGSGWFDVIHHKLSSI
jgi:hypothetical protein